jgi:hypothetical protein
MKSLSHAKRVFIVSEAIFYRERSELLSRSFYLRKSIIFAP